MDLGDFETTVKVIVVGNGGVGKSSMTARYCKGVFTDTYKKTIGVDFLEKTIDIAESGESVKLMIWDTAGQEEFDALTASYYRGAGACALVFSTVDRASFEAIEKWRRKVLDECGPGVVLALVQNKVDLIDAAAVSPGEVEDLARRLGVRLYRTCVKANLNVGEVFEYLAAQHILKGGAEGGGSGGAGAVAAVGAFGEGSVGGGGSTASAKERDSGVTSSRGGAAPAGSSSGSGGATPRGAAPARASESAPVEEAPAASSAGGSVASAAHVPAAPAAAPAAAAAAPAAAPAAAAARPAAAEPQTRIRLGASDAAARKPKKGGLFSAC